MKLRPYQQEVKDRLILAWNEGHKVPIIVLPTGAGKCLGKGTPILMYDGTIRAVETIKEGELLMGADSTPRKVLSTCSGVEMMYEIKPIKGDSYIVNESHIISLKQTGIRAEPKYPCEIGKGNIVNLSVLEYLSKSKYFKHTHKGWRTGVTFAESRTYPKELPPYLLGLWLGDGHSRTSSITTADYEIVNYLTDYCTKLGFKIRKVELPNNKASEYHISNSYKAGSLQGILRKFDLIKNKHIPHIYLTGSIEQRLELLAGIIDSDGFMDHNGYDLVFKVERLAKDILYLARSLGFAAYIKPCKKTCTNTRSTGEYFRISISGSPHIIPVKIQRYQNKIRLQKKDVLVTGISVNPIGIGKYYGFEIDGDHLFVLGDFTVTHNTAIVSDVFKDHKEPSCMIAHRQELVSQISLALARQGVVHKIIGQSSIVKLCVSLHMNELGRSYFSPTAHCAVAGVDTLIRREEELKQWCQSVTLWGIDECHHVIRDNKWGKAVEMFPNAKGLGVTATPQRADGKGLGREHDGVADVMIEGVTMRWLINNGYLTEYRVFAPPSDLDLSQVKIGSTGDYSHDSLVKATRKSHVMGDVVEHYLRIAKGKLGITFATDVQSAKEIAQRFVDAGVPAVALDAKTPDAERIALLRKFKNREIMQVVNVDLFGEGFDLPAIEVVSMARATESYGMYVQIFGRALRLMEGKEYALIIDHVGNVIRHGLPDAPRQWSLERREKRSGKAKDPDEIPVRACPECTAVYERIHPSCPYCGFIPVPASRSLPEYVDGDLHEFSPELLARLRGEIEKVDMSVEDKRNELIAKHVPIIGQMAGIKRHKELQASQSTLREQMAWWGGLRTSQGMSDSEIQRRFYFRFGIDVMSAKALGRKEAEELTERIAIDNYVSL